MLVLMNLMRLIAFLEVLKLLLNQFDGMMLVFVLLLNYLITSCHHFLYCLNDPHHLNLKICLPFVLCQMIYAIYQPNAHETYLGCLDCQMTVLVDCNFLSGLSANFAMYVMRCAKMHVSYCDWYSCDVPHSPFHLVMLTNLDILNVFPTLFANDTNCLSIRMCATDQFGRCRIHFSSPES